MIPLLGHSTVGASALVFGAGASHFAVFPAVVLPLGPYSLTHVLYERVFRGVAAKLQIITVRFRKAFALETFPGSAQIVMGRRGSRIGRPFVDEQ